MRKTTVLNVVGLTNRLIGEDTPFLRKWSANAEKATINPVLPAVTCSVQATYLTGKLPCEHGIVGNGWYCREDSEVKFWKQSNKLVQADKIWDIARRKDPSFTCANMFWWYNMYSTVDYSVTPRPQYLADGRKLPDVYSFPSDLRETLQKKLGTFPLFDFWGPKTSIRSSQWIADASILVDQLYNPTLTLVYLPHLDYCFQKYGENDGRNKKDLQEIDSVCEKLVHYYESKGAQVIVLSEYGITNVDRPVALNRILRKEGLLSVREERGLELLDAGASKTFAVADHQLAHVYVNDKTILASVKNIIEQVEGVEMVLDEEGKRKVGLNHKRSGDLVAVADNRSWFSYYYWLEDKKAPDYARTVDIHRKPGYDPVEMFVDPEIKFLLPQVAFKLAKKKMGFRTLMDIIPLNDSLVKGSHGRLDVSEKDKAIFITKQKDKLIRNNIEATEVYDILLNHLGF